jgi:Druantia protein DruA
LASATSKRDEQAASPRALPRRNGRKLTKAKLRGSVIAELERAGFVYREGLLELPEATDPKELVRRLHALHRQNVLVKNASFLDKWEDSVIGEFASGDEVDPGAIQPLIEPVDSEHERAVFRFATLHWSVPVSQGYGRRSRFLIRDGATGKLIGVFALGDPVFNLGVRDKLIGWNQQDRQERLYNVFDAYVLGAVGPYRNLIGGKLAALCALSNETADFLVQKYHGAVTEIRGETKSADPVLMTTTSSLGRSAIYSRLKYRDRWAYRSIGFTGGFGHFHFSDKLFARLLDFLQGEGHEVRGHQYGEGPNWRIRTIRKALDELGLDGNLLRHGIKREVFVAPRAMGWRAFLRGESTHLHWIDFPLDDLADFWKTRWGVPRSERDETYKEVSRDSMRLTPQLEAASG